MSKVEKLNQRTDKFCIVLNDSGADIFHNSKFICDKLRYCDLIDTIFVAVIKHDKDVDEESNHVKTLHYHVVLHVDKVCRISTMINVLCELFHCNSNQITIDKCNSMEMQVRYLIHLDDMDKYQYSLFDIESNNYDTVNKCMALKKIITNIDELITLVRQYKNLLELMSIIGYTNYRKYRVVISDIRKELNYQL